MRALFAMIAVVGFGACAPQIPDSGASVGVGFKNYDTYLAEQRAREQALRTGQPVTVQPVNVQLPSQTVNSRTDPTVAGVPPTPEQETANAAVAAVRGQDPVQVASATQVPTTDNPDLSDEQDFQAVSGRQSIESNAERLKSQSAQYEVVAPKALPSRPRGNAQTPIEFAVATNHPIGSKVYGRSPFGSGKYAAACAKFTSGEAAQDAFLKAGGPKRDKLGVDPDGDGYACRWDPTIYRVARTN